MATQKPISTVSYNSEQFLKEKLDSWVQQHIIQCYQYICHKGEDGDKDHIHVRIEPNKKLDPMSLTESLREYDKDHPTKPLGVRPWRPSKEEDWILYAVHEPTYLRLKYGDNDKGEKLPYKWTDIKANEYYDVEVAFIRAKSSMEHSSVNMATRLQQGENAKQLILQGENPYIVNALVKAFSMTDYERVASQLSDAQYRLDRLIKAIDDYNLLIVEDENGNVSLTIKTE